MPESIDHEPTRDEIDQMPGPVLLEFGATWCPHCQALAPKLAELLAEHPTIRHIKIEDGPGRPLGARFVSSCGRTWSSSKRGKSSCSRPGPTWPRSRRAWTPSACSE